MNRVDIAGPGARLGAAPPPRLLTQRRRRLPAEGHPSGPECRNAELANPGWFEVRGPRTSRRGPHRPAAGVLRKHPAVHGCHGTAVPLEALTGVPADLRTGLQPTALLAAAGEATGANGRPILVGGPASSSAVRRGRVGRGVDRGAGPRGKGFDFLSCGARGPQVPGPESVARPEWGPAPLGGNRPSDHRPVGVPTK